MKETASLFFVALAICLLPICAAAAPHVQIETGYYSVSGNTAHEIRQDLNRKTPVRDAYGIKHDAETTWFVNWNFWWHESNKMCSIYRVETSVDINYLLPELTKTDALPKPLRQKWENFMRALMHHEKGHKDIGIRAAIEIEKNLQSMVRQSCKQLEVEANNLGDKIIEKYSRVEKEFDRRTNHGKYEGAIFP